MIDFDNYFTDYNFEDFLNTDPFNYPDKFIQLSDFNDLEYSLLDTDYLPTDLDMLQSNFEYFEPPTPVTFNFSSKTSKYNTQYRGVVDTARSFLGTKYTWGGKNPNTGFDCSGFISYVFKQNGINVPNNTAELFKFGTEVSRDNIQVGDIICTKGSGPTGRHVKLVSEIDNQGNIYTIEAKDKKHGIVEEKLSGNIISIRRVSNQQFNSKKQFVQTLENTYRELLTQRGYNPDFASILVAQDANESGWGKHLAGNFNYGGIKSKTGTKKKTTEYINGVKQTYYDSFRDFNSIEDFCNYKIDLLSSKRYNIFNTTNPDNPEEVFATINERGYSTTPNNIYVPQLLKIYNNVTQLL